MRRLRTTLLLSSALIPFGALPAVANPLGGNVVAGDASIAGESTPTVTVTQSSDKAIIDWRSFDIAPSETTQFVLPSQQSVTLNRVTGGEGASTIAGTLSANGQVFLINPDGILFSKDARIDVGGLLATTNDIANADFMAGSYRFSVPGNPRASIVNDGAISISDTGIAALVAPGVRNAGTIAANLGKISLASGNDFTLDFYGDHLISLAVDDTVAGQIIDVGTGKPLTDLVSNSGLLKADGGTVQLTASAARNIVDSVINNTSTIEADTVGMKNGRIVLSAATAKSKPSGAPIQTVKVSGSLSAAGKNPGETGGAVEITGEAIALTVATIDAYGWNGGGKVLAGGDYRGGNVAPGVIEQYGTSLEPYSIPTASYVIADPDTQITVDALHEGKGGKVILWSDLATVTAATITARGGGEAGDGGFVETSGEYLSSLTPVDASAANGVGGTWLLDPLDVHLRAGASGNYTSSFATIFDPAHPVPQFYTISVPGVYDTTVTAINALPTGSPSYIDTNDIDSALNGGSNVRITTRGNSGSAPGDIYVDSSIIRSSGTGTRYLNLDSAHDIIVAPGVSIGSYTDPMHILLDAHDGAINAPSMGAVGTEGGVLRLDASRGVTFHAASHMPGIFGLEINRDPPPSSQRVDVDVSFINDVIRFYYVGGVAYVLGGGVQLSDGSYSSFELRTHGLDGVLYDNAVNIRSGRGIAIVPDPGYNYGAAASDDFDGIPEFISGTPTSFSIGDEPTSAAVVPVLEVSDYGSSGIKYVPTAPSGRRLISQHLTSFPADALNTPAPTDLLVGSLTAANSTPQIDFGATDADFEAFLASAGIDAVKSEELSQVATVISSYILDKLRSSGFISVADTETFQKLISSELIDALKLKPNWQSLGVGIVADLLKDAAMELVASKFEEAKLEPHLAEVLKVEISTALDAGILTISNPKLAATCLECVFVVAQTQNSVSEVIKVGLALRDLTMLRSNIRNNVSTLMANADKLYELGIAQRDAENISGAAAIFRLSIQAREAAQGIIDQYSIFGIPLI